MTYFLHRGKSLAAPDSAAEKKKEAEIDEQYHIHRLGSLLITSMANYVLLHYLFQSKGWNEDRVSWISTTFVVSMVATIILGVIFYTILLITMRRMKKEKTHVDVLEDAAGQIYQFAILMKAGRSLEDIKEKIGETSFLTLEEYTGKTRDELETLSPGVCDAYDEWLRKLQEPYLTISEFNSLMEEAWMMGRDDED